MKKTQLLGIIFMGTVLFFLLLLTPLQNAENLYDSVIRIHVLANSNSKSDQEQKLAVRDSLLAYTRAHLSQSNDRAEAKAELEKHLGRMETLAEKTLSYRGSCHDVKIVMEEEYYPTRNYDALSLPAGKYLSLKVQIGNAEGKNWWCVLFPPLCLSSSVKTEDALADVGMDEENIATLMRKEEGYKIRFKILELFGKTRKTLQELF